MYAINPNQAHTTPKENHDGIVENLIDHLRELESEQLFDHFQIYQKDRTYIYKSETNEGFEAEVLQECLFGKWSKVEEEMIKEVKSSLKKFNEIRD